MKSSPSDLFAGFSLRAKTKLVVLGSVDLSSENGAAKIRSLNFIEHVSLTNLLRSEISHSGSPRTAAADNTAFALLRKWFWSRKPDAGFVLWDFPATLLQALMFDDWLDARQESLDAAVAFDGASVLPSIVEHYRNYGLLCPANLVIL